MLPPHAMRALMSLGPIVVFALILCAVYFGVSMGAAAFLAAMAAACFVGGGKFVILAGALDGAPLGVWSLAVLVIYADLATALFMLANIDRLERVRLIGPRFAVAHDTARRVLHANPWLRRLMWLGIAVFVAVPFQGTGAVIGVIVGRILGLASGAILGAVGVGVGVGAGLLALLAHLGREQIGWLVGHQAIGIGLLAVCLVLTAWLGRWFSRRGVHAKET